MHVIVTVIGNLLQKSHVDSSSDEGLKPVDMNGMIELTDVKFRYPSRDEVPVISENVFLLVMSIKTIIRSHHIQ